MARDNTEIGQEYQKQITELETEIETLTAEIAEIYTSKSWRLIVAFRWAGRQYQRARRMLKVIRFAQIRSGGILSLAKKTWHVLRKDGWVGLEKLVHEYLERQEKQENSPVLPDSIYKLDNREGAQRPGILFISHEATRTGAPVFLLNLIRYLAGKLNMEIIVLLRRGGELEAEFRSIGITILLDNPNRVNSLILQSLKKRNIKLIYSNTITNGMIQVQLRRLGCPILCHVHELAHSIESFFGDENVKRIKETTSLFLAGSKAVAVNLIERLDVSEDLVVLAYPFIKVQDNQQTVNNERITLDLQKDALVVGACGTLAWRKSPDIFLQVARLVLQQTEKPVVFVWVGGPLSHSAYFDLYYDAKMMGIDKKVIFTGNVTSHIPYFYRFDIFVLPSREDPFPLVALDAASLGVPIICFDRAGGIPELVELDAGIIIPYLDVESMAKSILKLIDDSVLREKFGNRAQEKVMERHDISIGGKHILEIIKKQIGK